MIRSIQKLVIPTLILAITVIVNACSAQGGSENEATVNITKYSDYQCPTCAYFHPIVEQVKDNFGDEVHVEYRYFPLDSHRYATLAARAAQAAKNQGKFKQMHDLLFENQDRWSSSGNPTTMFVNYARKLDLDMDQFTDDLNATQTQETVMEQKQEGVNRNVRATPTFFINGEKVQELPQDYQSFEQLVQSYLNEAQAN